MISRRSIAKAVLFTMEFFRPLRLSASKGVSVRIGAIRWDAWYGGIDGEDNSRYAAHNLDPNKYHSRAPWFATELSKDSMSIDGNQANMDREILYAQTANIGYWAFCKYSKKSALTAGWNLFQKSGMKLSVNWCWIFTYSQFHHDVSSEMQSLINQCGQKNYEKVENNRPLIYLMADNGATVAQISEDIKKLKDVFVSTLKATPYVVTMNGSVENARSAYAALNADAVSSYGFAQPTDFGTYASLVASTQSFWDRLLETGLPLVPCGVTGWDRRPRVERPVPWEKPTQEPSKEMSNSFATARPSEIALHVQALINFVKNNYQVCQARSGLIYAWDEFDEGGWICPTWTKNGPDDARLKAIQDLAR